MDPTVLSALDIPFPSAINPMTRYVEEHTRDWSYRFGLVRGLTGVRRVRRMRLGYLAGRTYPRVPFQELAVAADWLSWLLLLDQHVEELPPVLTAAVAEDLPCVVAGALQPGEPLADSPASRALANLWRRTARLTSAGWQQRCAADLVDYLRLLRQESGNGQYRVLRVESYRAAGRFTSGVNLALDLIEAAERIDVPTDLAASPEYQELRAATNDVVSWTNDIAAQSSQAARDNGTALRRATEAVYGRVEDFLAAKRALPFACDRLMLSPGSRDGLRRVVAGCEAWMRGNRDWSLDNARHDGWTVPRVRASWA